MKDYRVKGVVTLEEQTLRWVAGESICPNTSGECCPDFSCCRPKLRWDDAKRKKFAEADRGTQEKMMMGALTALIDDTAKKKAHVTRGVPGDRE